MVLPVSPGVTAVLGWFSIYFLQEISSLRHHPGVHGADRSMGNMCRSVAAVSKRVKHCRVAEKALNYHV